MNKARKTKEESMPFVGDLKMKNQSLSLISSLIFQKPKKVSDRKMRGSSKNYAKF